MKIGLYGGTFDPPHNAHLELAQWVQNELELNVVYFIPAAIHAFKNNTDLSAPHIRLKLVEKAIKDYKNFKVSRIELDRPETSYTIHTLQNFIKYEGLPDCDMYYILGYDNLAEFHRWKAPEKIINLAKIVVIRRIVNYNQEISADRDKNILYLNSPIINISSTEIRDKIRSGMDVSTLVPPSVLDVIYEHGLYGAQKK